RLLQHAGPEDETRRSLAQRLSGPGLVLLGLTVTFAAIDWVMSIEPFWYSTIFGMLFISGQVLAALALGILCLVLLRGRGENIARAPLADLGSLLLTLVMI